MKIIIIGLILSFGASAEQMVNAEGYPVDDEGYVIIDSSANEAYLDVDSNYSPETRTENNIQETYQEPEYNASRNPSINVTKWHGEGGIISLKNNKLFTPWGNTYFPKGTSEKDADWVAFKWHGPGGVIYLTTDGNLLRSWAGGYYFPYIPKNNYSSRNRKTTRSVGTGTRNWNKFARGGMRR